MDNYDPKNVANSDDNNNQDLSPNEQAKIILPRKRKITKNVRFPIMLAIFLTAFLTGIVWKLFFNQSLIGSWYYIEDGEYTETFDLPKDIDSTTDAPDKVVHNYSQRVCYEFTDRGECIITLGTMSVKGSYNLYSTDNSNMFTAVVSYQGTSLLYGSYHFKITGNTFSEKQLTLSTPKSDEEIVLKEGRGESPLKKFDNYKGDEKLVGTWYDKSSDTEYQFTSDGYFNRRSGDGLSIEHTYTIYDEDIILARYYSDTEQSFSYKYSFDDDNNLVLNGETLEKIK